MVEITGRIMRQNVSLPDHVSLEEPTESSPAASCDESAGDAGAEEVSVDDSTTGKHAYLPTSDDGHEVRGLLLGPRLENPRWICCQMQVILSVAADGHRLWSSTTK